MENREDEKPEANIERLFYGDGTPTRTEGTPVISGDAAERSFWIKKWGRVVDGPLAEVGVGTLAELRHWCEEVTFDRYQVVTIAGVEYLGDEWDESEWPWLLRVDRKEDGTIIGYEPVPYKGALFHSVLADIAAAGNTVVLI